jgi:exosome complex RNA-binding protein Rrp42 (RNase PH superfamily)
MELNLETGELETKKSGQTEATKPLHLRSHPLCLTAGLYEGHLIIDLNAEEEGIVCSSMSVLVNDQGTLLGTLLGRIHNDGRIYMQRLLGTPSA